MPPFGRRRSVDSSSSSSDSSKGHKGKKEKKDKKSKKNKMDQKKDMPSPSFPSPSQGVVPPPYSPPTNLPTSGYRVPLSTTTSFPGPQQAGQPPCHDADGVTPVFIGSALFQSSVHPCKIVPPYHPACRVPYAGSEFEHHGRYDLLPFTPDTMELVRTSYGQIPPGRRPVEGGYEENGAKLYHGIATVNGVRVPGKTGEHLSGCNVAFGGAEHQVTHDYEILCWR